MDGKTNFPANIGTYSANIKGLCVCVAATSTYIPLCCIVKVKIIKILPSNPTWPEWKARLFHRNCLRSGQQQQQQVDIQSWWQRHANIWSRIVQWLYHAPLTTTHKYFTGGRSLCGPLRWHSCYSLSSYCYCYNLHYKLVKLRVTTHLLSMGQRLHWHSHVETRMVDIKWSSI